MIDSNGSSTPAGNGSLQLSIEQAWYNALVEGLKLGCLDEMISIAALCSTRHSIFAKPHPQRYAAAIEHAEFCNPISDHMTELDAFYKWQQQCTPGEKEAATWCHEKFLDVEALNEALKLRKELLVKCYELFGVRSVPMLKFGDEEYDMKIRKAILGGFYHHTATVDDPAKDQYKTLDNYPVGIDPDSSLVGMGWKFIVYNEIGFTSHAYMDRCTVVELDWLLDIDYFNTENLPQDYNGRLRNKKVREIRPSSRTTNSSTPLIGGSLRKHHRAYNTYKIFFETLYYPLHNGVRFRQYNWKDMSLYLRLIAIICDSGTSIAVKHPKLRRYWGFGKLTRENGKRNDSTVLSRDS